MADARQRGRNMNALRVCAGTATSRSPHFLDAEGSANAPWCMPMAHLDLALHHLHSLAGDVHLMFTLSDAAVTVARARTLRDVGWHWMVGLS
jgi:hypothetical protein